MYINEFRSYIHTFGYVRVYKTTGSRTEFTNASVEMCARWKIDVVTEFLTQSSDVPDACVVENRAT